jgi:hypothetical protein
VNNMNLWSPSKSWFHSILQRSRAEREMDAELRFHIEAYAEDLIPSGVPRDEALRRARVRFGGFERAKEECRDATGTNLAETLFQNFGFAVRM